jgi:hypothetical protein
MIRRMCLAAALTLIALPALADYDSRCVEPYAPTIPDGNRASLSQINAARAQVTDFIAQSDAYQSCLLLDLKTQKDTAVRNNKPLDPHIPDAINAKIAANQREKERLGAEYHAAAHAYNEAHPVHKSSAMQPPLRMPPPPPPRTPSMGN